MDTSIDGPTRTRHAVNHLADFANIFKAFIGANFLSVPYGLMQSGLLTGIIGLLLIAALTDHCCKLLVKCKDIIVNQIVKEYEDITRDPLVGNDGAPSVDESQLTRLRERIQTNMTYTDIGRICMGRAGIILVSSSLLITQFSFCVAYFIFIGNSLYRMVHPYVVSNLISPENSNSTTNLTSSANNSTNSTAGLSVISSNVSNTAYGMSVKGKTSPRLEVLILSPLPLLLLLSFIRYVRHLGFTSVVANSSLLLGFIAITIYMAIGFEIGPNINYLINLHSFPVFFGQLTSAYEGIGLIIPIQSSMVGNRRHFTSMLSTAIFLLTVVFLVFGILGFLRYGSKVGQSINLSITPPGGPLSLVINVSLIIGILFTFSLQMMPVYDVIEPLIFTQLNPDFNRETNKLESEKLIEDTADQADMPLPIRQDISKHVPTLRRNLLRGGLVVIAAALAVACKDIFAYVIAISGGIGSSILAFILPGIFHIKLDNGTLPTVVIVKDVVIIIIGVVGGLTSVVYSIKEIVDISRNVR